MKKRKYAIATVIILFISGCIPSLHPLYFDKDRITVEEIEGKWISSSDRDIWDFTKIEKEPSYNLAFTDEDHIGDQGVQDYTANFDANIVKLGGCYFIDLYPGDNKQLDNMNSLLSFHLVGAHTILKLEIKKEELLIYYLSPEWLEDVINSGRIRIKHEVVDDDKIVLTASTKELQKFITKYANDEDAFQDPEVLTLMK